MSGDFSSRSLRYAALSLVALASAFDVSAGTAAVGSQKTKPKGKPDPLAAYRAANSRLESGLAKKTVKSYLTSAEEARKTADIDPKTIGADDAGVAALKKLPAGMQGLGKQARKLVELDGFYLALKKARAQAILVKPNAPEFKKDGFELRKAAFALVETEIKADRETLGKAAPAFESVFIKMTTGATPMSVLKPKADEPAEAIALATAMNRAFPGITFARANGDMVSVALKAAKDAYSPLVKPLHISKPTSFDDADKKQAIFEQTLRKSWYPPAEDGIPKLLATLQKYFLTRITAAQNERDRLAEDYALGTGTVVEFKTEQETLAPLVEKLSADYAAFLKAATSPNAAESTLLSSTEGVVKALIVGNRGFAEAVKAMERATIAERSHEVAKAIPLYYFRDVQRLVNLLHPKIQLTSFLDKDQVPNLSGLREAVVGSAEDLDDALAKLADLQFAVTEKQQALNGAQGRLAEARKLLDGFQEALRGKNLRTDALQNDIDRASRQETDAKSRLEDAKTRLSKAEAERDAATTDEEKAKAERKVAAAKNDVARAERTVKSAEERRIGAEDALETESARRADVEADRDAAKTKFDGAESEVKTLRGELDTLQTNLRTKAVAVASSRRTQALAALRESQGFATVRDNQPMLFAQGDSTKPDPALRVDIAGFRDNSTIYLRGRKLDVARVADLIAAIDRPTPQARLTLWEFQVSFQDDRGGVGRKEQNELMLQMENILTAARRRTTLVGSVLRDCVSDEVNRFADDFANRNNALVGNYGRIPLPHGGLANYAGRLVRLHFYESRVAERLGLSATGVSPYEADLVLRTLPDPGAVTTLGEALAVLTMANADSRARIVTDFLRRMDQELGGAKYLDQSWFKHWYFLGTTEDSSTPLNSAQIFANALRLLNVDDPSHGANLKAPTTIQAELGHAIRRGITQEMIHEVHDKEQAILRGILNATPEIQGALDVRYDFLAREFQLQKSQLKSIFTSRDPLVFERFAVQFPEELVNARIAAADDMIKRIVIAMEDDVERAFIRPAIYELQDRMRKKRLNVGLVQRTSVLASNRFPARVDAGATAQLAIDGKQDLLASAQQLAQMVVAGASQNPLAILNSLKSDPSEPPREVYGVTTGGLFNVTPVLDPSGQGLRFVFDHVQANRVRDPDGTVSPQLPRIERHTINTEVQLGGFELREFSRFQSNAQVGTPPHYWGGIPILNQIPVIRDIPLLGYFVRKGGRRATVQQSLVFGQTTVYPTIGDILNLATPLSNRARLGGG